MMQRLAIEQGLVWQQKSSEREDLAFSGFVLQREVNISYTDPPDKSLLLSNRQIFDEARGFFSTRYLEYWKLTKFSITYKYLNNNAAINLPDKALASIRLISVRINSKYLYKGYRTHRFHPTQAAERLLWMLDERVSDYIDFRRGEDGRWWSESVHQLEDHELSLVGGSDVLVITCTVGYDGAIHCSRPAELSRPSETPPAPKMAAPPPSSSLLTLPPEVRNAIWELSFSGTNRTVDLFESRAPAADLLLACHQICEEAKGFWPGKRGEYFSTTSFTITSPPYVLLSVSFSDHDITAIRHIKLLVRVRDIRTVGNPRSTVMLYNHLQDAKVYAHHGDYVLNCARLPGPVRYWESETIWVPKIQTKLFVNLCVRNDHVRCAIWPSDNERMPGLAFNPITREELSVLLGRDI
ncbi:hypothetical protein LTR17_002231 [Elasticomyces elasticus]|nr:hypothetical protein LTR17_002231 [Elasticomyces elasticus]